MNINMIDEFFPTPLELATKMITDINFNKIKTVLEPSAGKGDIVKALFKAKEVIDTGYYWTKEHYHSSKKNNEDFSDMLIKKYIKEQKDISYFSERNLSIQCIEIDETLRNSLKGLGVKVVANDFLNFNGYQKYDLIIMNPPFSCGDKHLLHAIKLQQKYGGVVSCILNAETIKNPYSNSRKELVSLLNEYNASIEFIENAFDSAERQTSVEIALIKIIVPSPYLSSSILDDLKKAETFYSNDKSPFEEALSINDSLISAVKACEIEMQAGIRLIQEYNSLKPILMSSLNEDNSYNKPVLSLSILNYENNDDIDINLFLYKIRYKYWSAALNNPELTGKLTSNLKNAYMSKIDEFSEMEFTVANIRQIQINIINEMAKGVEETILKLFDDFTYKYSCEKDGNIQYYNGWKTNEAFKINNKIIIPYMFAFDNNSWNKRWSYKYDVYQQLIEFEKVFNYLGGEELVDFPVTLNSILNVAEDRQENRNIDCNYFTLTFYKKGTCHMTFKHPELIKRFNIYGANKRGWLPPSYGKKHYKDMDKEEQDVIDNFQGEKDYEDTLSHKDFYLADNTKKLLLA